MTVGDRIKESRKKNGLSQKELGQKLNISQQMIAQLENSSAMPKIDTLQKIADALNIPLTYLLYGSIISPDLEVYLNTNDKESTLSEPTNLQDHASDHMHRITKYALLLTEFENKQKLAQLINLFDKLNTDGKNKALDQLEMLTKIPEYQQTITKVKKKH